MAERRGGGEENGERTLVNKKNERDIKNDPSCLNGVKSHSRGFAQKGKDVLLCSSALPGQLGEHTSAPNPSWAPFSSQGEVPSALPLAWAP